MFKIVTRDVLFMVPQNNYKNLLIMQYLYQKVNFLLFKKQSSLIFILNRDRMTFTVTSDQLSVTGYITGH